MDTHEVPLIALVIPFAIGYAVGAVSALLVAGLLRIVHREEAHDGE